MTRYVIIGGSAGAVGAVEAIREIDPIGEIIVVNEEPTPAYSRPMIADYLNREASSEEMLFPSRDFWGKHNVQLCIGKRAVKLDLNKKTVELEDAESISFDKLLIATGGKPFIPKMDGVNKRGVYNFTTMFDVQRIKEAIDKAHKAVVIGGGLIGVSATEALTKHGLKVTIVELKDRILSLILDREAAKIIEKVMQKHGVSIVTGRIVQRIIGRKENDNVIGGVILDNGATVECDIVVVAVGVVPRTELANQTDLKVNRGILVDKFMQTNVPDVYACGDVAEAYDFINKTNRVIALWPIARIGGRIAGYNMAGHKCEYSGGTAMSALHYFGVPIISVGSTVIDEAEGYETLVFNYSEANVYRKFVLKDGKIVGFTLVGDVENAGVFFNLMKNQVRVESFKERLVDGTFGWASLPENLRKQLLWRTC
ncbi:MAG: FAD-dependent oxidoreductase [Candidatus Bathyarchaeia archaeon]